MVRLDYEASGGKEIFLSFEDENETLFGLLRLRIESQPPARLGQESQGDIALIRELHVYGPEVSLGQQDPNAAQHRGLGKALLGEAERIAAREFGLPQMVVLSGVGAKEYYRSEFGYSSQGDYMVKRLPQTSPVNLHPAQAVLAGRPRYQSDGLSHALLPGVSQQ